jgi:hypothetical protein
LLRIRRENQQYSNFRSVIEPGETVSAGSMTLWKPFPGVIDSAEIGFKKPLP